VAGLDEPQRHQLVPNGVVEADLGRLVPQLEAHGGVEPGGAGPEIGRGRLPSGHLVGEDEFQELGMAHAAGLG
jgi:hypothetical protein